MYKDPRQKPWEKKDGGRFPAPKLIEVISVTEQSPGPIPVSVAEDSFIGHPVGETTVLVDTGHLGMWTVLSEARALAKGHRLALINFGTAKDGRLALTFRTKEQAAIFRMFWDHA